VDFVVDDQGVVLEYTGEDRAGAWVWHELTTRGEVTVRRAFTFLRKDLLEEPPSGDQADLEAFVYRFRLAQRDGDYHQINGRHFGIDNQILIVRAGLKLERKVFVAERNVRIFSRIAKLVPPGQRIVVGGALPGHIPLTEFATLLAKFPNSTELDRYANARVASILGDYLDDMRDARQEYERYLDRKETHLRGKRLGQEELLHVEIEKYVYMRDTLVQWLSSAANHTEKQWQQMLLNFILLLFPKYVAVLENVRIKDSYSSPGTTKDRYIDLALVDASGNLDIIEIKKPFDNALVSKALYRDNSVPTKELSGSIMQAEKYLFHLSKWGRAGETKLTTDHGSKLPDRMEIRITNPKAIIILGRDRLPDGKPALNDAQSFDLEVIRRKYANMMDIITYDDLVRRLDRIIEALRRRSGEAAPPLRGVQSS
jgi:hypothetical protein